MLKKSLMILVFWWVASYSITIELTECEDISMVKPAYANNGLMHWEDHTKDTLIMNSWKC